MPKSHALTIRLSAAQYTAVQRLSLHFGINITNILRMALARFIEEENHRQKEAHPKTK
jgi:predicted transcriptional regulator